MLASTGNATFAYIKGSREVPGGGNMKKNRVVQFDDDGKISQDTTDQQFADYYNVLDSGHVSLRIVEHQNFVSYDLVFPLYSTKRSILAAIGLAEKEHGANDGIAFITYQAQSRMGWPSRVWAGQYA